LIIGFCCSSEQAAATVKNDADGHSLEWESPAAQALQRVLLSDNNKYVHAFAHEAVRRLSTSVPTPVKASL
jgi:hypothetical protein